jgi:type I restriction-modification system DNA methylase subunit
MKAPKKIEELVEHFDSHIDELKDKNYKEASLCTDFLNPFFHALDWDVYNKKGYAERFRDVVQQYSEKSEGGTTKQPDYLFRIGASPAFFLEAKKPAVDILTDRKPAYQLRRYGWNRKDIGVSILSDFEHLCIYDVRIQPKESERPHFARLAMYGYKDFINKWEEIHGYLARENVAKGSLDRLLKDYEVKGKKEPVDESLLKMIELWREKLAKNIALRNKDLDIGQLNSAVQRTIDRILFLRICEDRGIENPNKLLGTKNGKNIYARLIKQFQDADVRYNSGLFHFNPEKGRPVDYDNFTLGLKIDDNELKEIISNLYPPNYPFDFSVMPVDILGHVYERFLGKVIRLTDSHQAKVEEKPEVRKAGGVYYTPKYIVDYIVKNTVGKLVEGKNPDEVSGLKILDPACGSGSFLLGAYQYLLDWHLDWYVADNPEKQARKKNPAICEIKNGWKLTTSKRKEILLNNIYGVDIDTQAVEVAKLNLLLKVLEQENTQDLFKHSKRALPDLANNIKCGNSLIESDFYENHPELVGNLEETRKINAFDWNVEFPDIVKWKSSDPLLKGVNSVKDGIGGLQASTSRQLAEGFGFDAVIGNPPYVDSEWMVKYLDYCREYCNSKYDSSTGNWDIFCVFIEKAILLSRVKGFTSMIVPNKLLSANYASSIRKYITSNTSISNIRDYSSQKVFPVSVYPIVFIIYKGILDLALYEVVADGDKVDSIQKQQDFFKSHNTWQLCADKHVNDIIDKLSNTRRKLSDISTVTGAATVSEAYEYKEYFISDTNVHGSKIINSGTIDRYASLWGVKPMQYIKQKYEHPILPESCYSDIKKKRLEQAGKQKIIIAGMTKRLECYLDYSGEYLAAKSTTIVVDTIDDIRLYLAILNSKLISFYFINQFKGNSLQGGYLRVGPPQLKEIPIPKFNTDSKKIIQLVETMLKLNKQLAEVKSSHDKKLLTRQIEATDRQIDALVYDLYNLTPGEIQIVEDSFK